MKRFCTFAVTVFAGFAWPCAGHAEILAMLNYESKTADALKSYKSPVPGQTRTEGIAIIDVDLCLANLWQNCRDHSVAAGSRCPSHFL